MTKPEFVKAMTYLGMMYGKSYSEEEINLQFEFYKDLDYRMFVKTIKEHIKSSSFEPKVSDLLKEYKGVENSYALVVIERMKNKGYFKHPREYEKIISWVQRGIIPEWFKEDMKAYMEEPTMLNNKTNEVLQIGG